MKTLLIVSIALITLFSIPSYADQIEHKELIERTHTVKEDGSLEVKETRIEIAIEGELEAYGRIYIVREDGTIEFLGK